MPVARATVARALDSAAETLADAESENAQPDLEKVRKLQRLDDRAEQLVNLLTGPSIDQFTFAAHDSLAPYSGPYPMALLVRAFIVEKINGWDETALYNYLHANPSLRRKLGFETLPAQSTFWRAWNHRFSDELRDAVEECADSIIMATRASELGKVDLLCIVLCEI